MGLPPLVRTFGLADSTTAGRAIALRLYNKLARKMGLPQFQDLTPSDLDGDQAKDLLGRLCYVLSRNAIPKLATDDLLPADSNNAGYLSISTVKQYLGRIRMCLEEKSPDLPIFFRKEKCRDRSHR